MPKLPKSITLIGRRWFQRTYGNTYHTVEVHVDGERVFWTTPTYGYGDQWEETGLQWLLDNDHIPENTFKRYDNGGHEPIRIWAERNGVQLVRTCSDVAREKDL